MFQKLGNENRSIFKIKIKMNFMNFRQLKIHLILFFSFIIYVFIFNQ